MASISIRCPSCSATEGVVRNGKSTAGHQRYLCSHCRKTWQLQFTYTASQPGTHQKIIDMAMNGVGCRASARIMGVGLNTVLRHLKNSGPLSGGPMFITVMPRQVSKPLSWNRTKFVRSYLKPVSRLIKLHKKMKPCPRTN
ncbi:IS1-like element transposase, partial [Shigella flexneri]|uniref:IS1-like element transposase n=1 Tax=Shigella flexneri TaxID=623 RepID=UPI001EE6C35C